MDPLLLDESPIFLISLPMVD